MTRIGEYNPWKLKRGIFGFLKKEEDSSILHHANYIGTYYPNKK